MTHPEQIHCLYPPISIQLVTVPAGILRLIHTLGSQIPGFSCGIGVLASVDGGIQLSFSIGCGRSKCSLRAGFDHTSQRQAVVLESWRSTGLLFGGSVVAAACTIMLQSSSSLSSGGGGGGKAMICFCFPFQHSAVQQSMQSCLATLHLHFDYRAGEHLMVYAQLQHVGLMRALGWDLLYWRGKVRRKWILILSTTMIGILFLWQNEILSATNLETVVVSLRKAW